MITEFDIVKREYYESEQWKLIRNICYEMSGFICQKCGAAGRQIGGPVILHAHHLTYVRFGMEELTDLKCLCSKCHKIIHKRFTQKDMIESTYISI